MKITGIKTYKFSVPTGQALRDPSTGELVCSAQKGWLFLKIETDGGIDGWGEGSGEWLVEPVEATLHMWRPLLEGSDPLRAAALTEDLCDRSPWKGGPVFGTAAAAVNMALYDIAGKAWGVPAHAILGGKRRDRIRVYSNGMSFESPQAAVEAAQSAQADGFSGGKGNPLEGRRWPMDMHELDNCMQCVGAVRQAMGEDWSILLDTHGSPTPQLAIEFARRVAEHRPLFLEEPVKVGSVEALKQVSDQSPVPIATGEKVFTLGDFKALIDARACAFLQPDVGRCFGMTNLMKIAAMAEQAQMLMAPHNVGGPMTNAATLHCAAAIPNFLIQEITASFFPQYLNYAEHDWTIADGYINVSDQPGLGVTVKEQDIARLAYQPMEFRQYRHEDGSWKGW